MSAASFKAAVPEPFQILGLRMRPLSLGRYRLMRYFENGFVAEGERAFKMEDLILGVLICSMRVDEFLAWFGTKQFQREVRRWSKRICPRSWRALMKGKIGQEFRKKHSFLIHEKAGLFTKYLDEGSRMPKFWDESEGSGGSGSHWSHGVEVVLRSEVGWSEEEINERPMTKAFADWLKYLENQGQVKILTEDEIAMGEANARRFEQMAAAAAASMNGGLS